MKVVKAYNIKRHYEGVHQDFAKKLPENIELKRKLFEIKVDEIRKLSKEMNYNINRSDIATIASFKITYIRLKKQKPFSDGEMVKECIKSSMETILKGHKDQEKILKDIESIQLSRRTVTRRAEVLSKEIQKNLMKKLANSIAMSICLDESIDRKDISQLIIWVRSVDRDLKVSENILDIQSLTSTTTAKDIIEMLDNSLQNFGVVHSKLTAITTDGAANMTGKNKGVVSKLKEKNPYLISPKCIIHQEALCAKFGIESSKNFADFVMKVINKLISNGASRHRQFMNFLSENDAEIKDLEKMQQVRWLSCESVFRKFISVVDLVDEFFKQLNPAIIIDELSDIQWKIKLAFFTDLSCHLGRLNQKLQGKMNNVWTTYKEVTTFMSNLDYILKEFKSKEYHSFVQLNILISKHPDIDTSFIISWLEMLKSSFDGRFEDFKQIVPLMKFGNDPKSISLEDLKVISNKTCIEFNALKDDFLRYKSELLFSNDDESLVVLKTFINLKIVNAKCLSIFSSSYRCESAFSKMNFILSEYRTNMTQSHIKDALYISCSDDPLDIEYMVKDFTTQIGH